LGLWRDELARGQHSLIPGRNREKRTAELPGGGELINLDNREPEKPRELLS
jgi:hypothetical protein